MTGIEALLERLSTKLTVYSLSVASCWFGAALVGLDLADGDWGRALMGLAVVAIGATLAGASALIEDPNEGGGR